MLLRPTPIGILLWGKFLLIYSYYYNYYSIINLFLLLLLLLFIKNLF